MRHQVALVVLDFDRIGADFEVPGQFPRLGPKRAGAAGFHEGDAGVDRHGHRAVGVGRRGEGEVGQGKNGAALHRADAIEMVRLERHARRSAAG